MSQNKFSKEIIIDNSIFEKIKEEYEIEMKSNISGNVKYFNNSYYPLYSEISGIESYVIDLLQFKKRKQIM